MRAVVIERPGEVALREIDAPVCGPEDVVVRSRAAGVCRTDLEVLKGELDPRWVRYPCVPGHEWSGEVVEVGARVEGVAPGDRVVCEGMIPCGRCRRCAAGDTNLCENYDQLGFTRVGGYGELVLAPARVVHRLPEHVSFDAGVLVEPASVVLRALERGRAGAGEAVGVVGVGTLGSLAIVLARLVGPSRIVAYGTREEELELALRLGADEAVDVSAGEPVLGELDLVLETAGAVPAVDLSTRLVREGGRVVLLGIAGEGKTLAALPADRVALRDLELIGSVGYTSAAWTRVVGLLADRRVDLDPIVTHRFPLEEFEQAFELMENRTGVVAKIVLEHAPTG
ncbi:MAG TPA: alcohol dehydrogenase catalytic domain-containing protein [Gaiellaceae bacterium]|nr:alcohol dehydrogenase catalytic domain-containing protein [Gaiellaceae bacterium]